MQGMGLGHVAYRKGKVKLVFTQIVRFFAAAQPRQLQHVGRGAVRKKAQGEIGRFFFAHNVQAQRLFIKGQALFQIQHVEVIMCKGALHESFPSFVARRSFRPGTAGRTARSRRTPKSAI